MNNSIAILIPAYNEVLTIRSVVKQCLQYTNQILVIDDGSSDKTVEVIQDLPIQVVRHEKNAGKGQALLTGFAFWLDHAVSGVITIDADGQHDPSDFSKFFERIVQLPNSIVIGARTKNTENAPKYRLFANKTADFFISLAARRSLNDTQSGFRYYPISFLTNYVKQKQQPHRFAFEVGILVSAVRSGLPVQYVDIQSCYPDAARKSHYHPVKDTWRIIKTVVRMIFKK